MTATSHLVAPTIELTSVTVRHRRGAETVIAVDDVTCRFAPASMTAVVGPSGSGKTTLVNVILGATRPDVGRVIGVGDHAPWTQVAFVPQQLGLLEELTLGENVSLAARLGRVAPGPVTLDDLEIGHLADRLPGEVSLGEQQRAAVCRALVTSAPVVVADEPTSHQDARRIDAVATALRRHADQGALVIVATHDARVVERCDRVLAMSDGRLVDGDGASHTL